MKLEHKIIAARPKTAQTNSTFTDNVMLKIEAKQPRRKLALLFRKSPAFAVLVSVIALVAITGTAYAISYVIPLLNVSVTKPAATTSGRQSVEVFSNECSEISGKKYELKKVAPFGAEKIADVVKAECNLEAISNWADAQYPNASLFTHAPPSAHDTTPSKVFTDIQRMDFIEAFKIKTLTPTSITFEDPGNQDREITLVITANTKFIVDHQYKTRSDLKVGDAVAYVNIKRVTEKNNDDCTPQSCGTTIISATDELLDVIKLDMPYENYGKFGSLSELAPCAGNDKEYCHTGNTASFDLYNGFRNMPQAELGGSIVPGQVEGVIVSHESKQITIKTSSGRTVQLNTNSDLVQDFNNTRAADYNTTVENGDTISVMYMYEQSAGVPQTINQRDIGMIQVLIEINSKADLTPYAAPSKY